MAYKITDIQTLKEYFRNLFGFSLGQFIDTLMTAIEKRIVIDIIRFDQYLHKTHPEDEYLSCDQIIFKHYGDEAAALIDELI